LFTLDAPCQPGQTERKTFDLNTNVRFIKIMVENLDESESVSDLSITVTVGG
jgi:hypothetical protein